MAAASDVTRNLFVTGLQNVHAVENQALALIDRQLERLESYKDVAARLKSHRRETERQIERVEGILESLGESNSLLKDTALSLTGNMAALLHTPASDEIIKNTLSNLAFENFEAGSYMALMTMAESGRFKDAIAPLNESFLEEAAMAKWIVEHLPKITRKYVNLENKGAKADR